MIAGGRQSYLWAGDGAGNDLFEVVTQGGRPEHRIHGAGLFVQIAIRALHVGEQSRLKTQRARQTITIRSGPCGTERRALLERVQGRVVRVACGQLRLHVFCIVGWRVVRQQFQPIGVMMCLQ